MQSMWLLLVLIVLIPGCLEMIENPTMEYYCRDGVLFGCSEEPDDWRFGKIQPIEGDMEGWTIEKDSELSDFQAYIRLEIQPSKGGEVIAAYICDTLKDARKRYCKKKETEYFGPRDEGYWVDTEFGSIHITVNNPNPGYVIYGSSISESEEPKPYLKNEYEEPKKIEITKEGKEETEEWEEQHKELGKDIIFVFEDRTWKIIGYNLSEGVPTPSYIGIDFNPEAEIIFVTLFEEIPAPGTQPEPLAIQAIDWKGEGDYIIHLENEWSIVLKLKAEGQPMQHSLLKIKNAPASYGDVSEEGAGVGDVGEEESEGFEKMEIPPANPENPCPDGVCDSYEMTDPSICPEDCADLINE